MPMVMTESKMPVDECLVEYDRSREEEIFLSHVWARREGPPILRSGEGSPYMEWIGGPPQTYTAHPSGLRLGTWLVRDELRAGELAEAESALALSLQQGRPPADIAILRQTVRELQDIPAHDRIFESRMPGWRLVAQASCGDLTMNYWNVACVRGPLADRHLNGPVLIAQRDEPLDRRTYSCLVKWTGGGLSIEQVRFSAPGSVAEVNQTIWVSYRGRWLPRADSIEFAISNQQVLRDGEPAPVATTCHQFGDIRHLIEMPNLNPNVPLFAREPVQTGGGYLPRTFFGRPQYDPVWFGEAEFLGDSRRNLLRAALCGPVLMGFPPGPGEDGIRGALAAARYREKLDPLSPLASGEWRFVRQSPTLTLVEIHYRRNTYAWTMLGLSRDRRRVLCLTTKGIPSRTGFHLEDAAEKLRAAGACDALLIDEGADTFHSLRDSGGDWQDLVKRERGRLRAVFLFAKKAIAEERKEDKRP